MLASILIGGREWIAPALGLGVIAVVVVSIRYADSLLDNRTRWLAAGLKTTALILLSACLMEPLWSGQRAVPGANLFAVLADNSHSLTIHDPGNESPRGDQLRDQLNREDLAWQVRLAQDFDVRRYQFDSRLQGVTDFAGLKFDGTRTHLGLVLRNLKERYRDRPLAGVLLFTDGIATDSALSESDLQGLPPLYPVVVGSARGHRDLAVTHLSVSTTSFEDAPVTVQADVTQVGLPGSQVTATLLTDNGAVVKEETQRFSSTAAPLAFRFQFRPAEPGLSFYEVKVKSSELAVESESAAANNRRLIAIDRGAGPYRILYLTGRPNWEFKFLNRAVEADDQVQLTAVVRVARREPKFDWRSRDGEATNPLFRGFDQTSEQTERYDQPVLVRLNTRDPNEFRDGFPKRPEDLYPFHAIILDDLEAEFFTADQLSLLEKFVSERGGGLLLLGGAESFRAGKYARTPVGRMAPFYLEGADLPESPAGYRLALTRDGWLQPWARLRSTETEELVRLKEMPAFLTVNGAGTVKPGATVIAEVLDGSERRHPALAVQRFGNGRCAALLIGDLWRWQLNRTDIQRDRDELGKAWRQTLRWLIADVPDRIALRSVPNDEQGQPLTRLEARIRTPDFRPQDNAGVTVVLNLPDGSRVTQLAEPSLREAGLYEATFATRQTGAYRAAVEVVDAEGKPLGKAESGWVSDPTAEEFQQVSPNRELLARIASQTGGELVELGAIDSLVDSLPTRQAPLSEAYTSPLWHQPWVLALIIGCLCGEWSLRRWRGLP